MRGHARDDHEGPEAHARDRGGARRGRAGSSGRRRLSFDGTRELFDRVAETYDVSAFPFFTPFGEALVEFAGVGPGDDVLDAGCGKGAVLVPAALRAGSAKGVELSPAMAGYARAAVPGADVVVGDAGALAFPRESFDLVLSGFVVFFFDDPTAGLREWARVLRPDGRLAISTWGDADPRWAFEREIRRGLLPEVSPEFLQVAAGQLAKLARFDSQEKVEAELTAAGFGDIEVEQHVIEFVYPDEQAWLDWNNSHASRAFIEALSADGRERFREQAFEAMQPLRTEDGFPRTFTALLARATLAQVAASD